MLEILDVDHAAVLLADETTGALTPRIADVPPIEAPLRVSRSIVEYAVSRSAAVHFADTTSDGRIVTPPPSTRARSAPRSSRCARATT
ncbi:MAG: hypothetical protein R3B70_14705 [Polyangiaceae bacterium]